MSIKSEIGKLKDQDIWSIMLFVLYKVREVPEYSALSELAYILDKKNMLKLCEYFGGCTITIPKIEELESMIYGLMLYQYTDVEHILFEDAVELISNNAVDISAVKTSYHKIKQVLENYDFTPRTKL
jgi:hypothetical protein